LPFYKTHKEEAATNEFLKRENCLSGMTKKVPLLDELH